LSSKEISNRQPQVLNSLPAITANKAIAKIHITEDTSDSRDEKRCQRMYLLLVGNRADGSGSKQQNFNSTTMNQ